jgi:hypothetical protein
VGTQMSSTVCLWCAMDCQWAPADDTAGVERSQC